MTISMTNDELRMTNWRFVIRFFVFLSVLCIFAGTSFAQNLENLAEQIKRGDTEQKRDALLQIRNLKSEDASRVAIPALEDSSEIVRATAAFSVIFLPKDEAARNLVPLLADKKSLVRREAAYALGKVGDASAIDSLLRVLQKDKIAEVRNAAIVALGAIGDASAISELVKILQRKPQSKEEFARRSAARSIGQIAQIIQTGDRKVITPENFSIDENKSIEKPNYPKLIETFPAFRAAVGALIETLRNSKESSDVKREAAFALGAIGDDAAVPILQANSNNEDYYLAEICREALKKISISANNSGINRLSNPN